MKVCSKCKETKDESEFYKDTNHKDGLQSNCKECHIEVVKKYKKTDKGKESIKKGKKYQKEYQYEYCRSETGKKSYSKFWKSIKGKITKAKQEAERKRKLGFVLINSWFPACNFHHLNETYVLAIPTTLHRRYRHNHKNLDSMLEINNAAIKWHFSLT